MITADSAVARDALAEGWGRVAIPRPLGEGHIHGTWQVAPGAGAHGLVLQQINTTVFTDPPALLQKLAAVIRHVSARAPGFTPALVATLDGAYGFEDAGGRCWRVFEHVADGRTLEMLASPNEAEAAGRAFGRFQALLRDFSGPLPESIPGFMQLAHYLKAFDSALVGSGAMLAGQGDIVALRRVIDARRDLAHEFAEQDRVVHADCKVNNLLFHRDRDEVRAVLDLDTVMRGHWAWDAGDLIRSAAWGQEGLSVARFAGVVRGFAREASIAAPPENWVLAPRYVTLMLGVRFLTDHLAGDLYFRVGWRGENLARAKEQFQLLAALERSEETMLKTLDALI